MCTTVLAGVYPGMIAAQGLAMTGQTQEALRCLAEAVRRGERNVANARQQKEFTSLHDLSEWEEVLNEMTDAAV